MSGTPAGPYVAPARYVLTALHRPDPARVADLSGPIRIDGWTVCGLPWFEDEMWMPVERRDRDQLCAGCMLPGSAVPVAEVEVGLW